MRLVAALARAGWRKDPRTTPREFVEELRRRGMPESDLVERLTEQYNGARFGGAAIEDAEYEAIKAEVRGLERALRRTPSAPVVRTSHRQGGDRASP